MRMQATEFATEKCCTILFSTLYFKGAGTVISFPGFPRFKPRIT